MKQRPKQSGAGGRARAGTPGEPSTPAAPLSPARRWAFRLLLLLLVPGLLLGGLEAVLRLAGYGYSTALFKPRRIGGHEFLVENDSFSYRFFSPELARTPGPLRMEPHKLPGTYRIFVLGESAAMGDPEPAFGASRYLEALLRERYPEGHFELINVAITAINSNVILPIARDCARQDGDLWIVYMGNNEMVGPFGAATVFGPKAPPLAFVRFTLALQRTRIGQLVTALARRLHQHSGHPASWAGMQMFLGNQVPPHAASRETVYRNFQQNLRDILRAGRSAGAKLLLNSVAVNLKDCAPFASMDRTNGTRESLTQLRAAAHRLEDQSKFAEAATTYGQAATLDPDSADLQFGWGHCLLAAGDTAAAREHFQQACDLDALPFRTDSRLNAILRHTAQEMAGPNLHFFDAAACLATNSPGDIPGQEYFYEHVHFNFDGNYRLARAWAEQIAPLLPPAQTHGALAAWASQEQCERRLGLTDWNRLIVLGDVLGRVSQPPLSTQANNAHRQATLAAWKNRLQEQIAQPGAAAQARQLYREALERVPDDYCLHENYGTFLVATGDLPGATAQWQRVRELIPQDYLANFRAGELLAQGPEPAAAEAPLREAIRLRPFMSDAWTELGKLYLRQQKFALALEQLNHAIELQPLDFVAWFNSGISLSKLNRRPEAIERYRHTIRINAGYWQAHFELGGQLGLQGELEQAKQQLEQAIAIEPKFAPAHLDLGVALMKLGQPDGAAKEFEETIRLDPGNRFAASYLGQLRRK